MKPNVYLRSKVSYRRILSHNAKCDNLICYMIPGKCFTAHYVLDLLILHVSSSKSNRTLPCNFDSSGSLAWLLCGCRISANCKITLSLAYISSQHQTIQNTEKNQQFLCNPNPKNISHQKSQYSRTK